MYPGYERYWTGIRNEPDKPPWITGKAPTKGELDWARFATKAPHYVLSSKLTSTNWPNTSFVRSLDDVAALKQQPGKNIYVVGGARTTASLLDAGLLDELRLIVYPLIVGKGKELFASSECRRPLELRKVKQLPGGKLRLIYEVG
jgi:dihydrofolate reductase